MIIKLENISKYYKLYNSPGDRLKESLHPFNRKLHREFYALRDINLEINQGEILGVVGRNGSGKSTLLSIISGVIQPNAGRKTINGRISALMDLGGGMNPDYDGYQNIYLGGLMMGFSHQEMKSKIDDIIDFADIGQFIHQPFKKYSSGMKARLSFALAISINPEILIIDEVLAVGDDMFRRKCFARMESIIDQGCTIIYVSHAIATVNQLCTRAILLDRGEIIMQGSPKDITLNYQKLIFSLPHLQESVRQEIQTLQPNQSLHSIRPTADMSSPSHPPVQSAPVAPPSTSSFLPHLVSRNPIITRNAEVEINDFCLIDSNGQSVNLIQIDQEYVYRYQVIFDADMENLVFSMAIHNEKGLNISSRKSGDIMGLNRFGQILTWAQKGDIYQIRWKFFNLLLPGNYYTNAMITTIGPNDERQIIYRITDAMIFKVMDTGYFTQNGLVDLHQTCSINRMESSNRKKGLG